MSKGQVTRERIVERAFRIAGRDGLEGLTIGSLAAELGLSKSGLFAHFGSKEDLQLEVLKTAADRFASTVLRPAFQAPRGLPRIRRLFEGWLAWIADPAAPGGCVIATAAIEFDDREGRCRDFVAGAQRTLFETIAKAARLAIEAGHFRPDLDADEFAFNVLSMALGYNHVKRLLRDPRAEALARSAFERLVADSVSGQPASRADQEIGRADAVSGFKGGGAGPPPAPPSAPG